MGRHYLEQGAGFLDVHPPPSHTAPVAATEFFYDAVVRDSLVDHWRESYVRGDWQVNESRAVVGAGFGGSIDLRYSVTPGVQRSFVGSPGFAGTPLPQDDGVGSRGFAGTPLPQDDGMGAAALPGLRCLRMTAWDGFEFFDDA